jgi:hypothetical protein
MRYRYEVFTPDRNWILSSFTLHGDHDADIFRVLNAMVREGVAICRTRYGEDQGIIVRMVEIDI